MKRLFISSALLLAATVLAVRAGVKHRHVEDFSTTQYLDTAMTTANWNTSAGAIELYPFQPSIVACADTPWFARDVWVSGDYAFVSDVSSGLQVVDISDPTNPSIVGSFTPTDYASDVLVEGDYAFVADGLNGVSILDVSDPAAPVRVRRLPTEEYARGIYVNGNYAYVLDSLFGLLVADVSDPGAAVYVSTRPLPDFAVDATVAGDVLFVATGPDGLNIFDVTDPAKPVHVTNVRTPHYNRQVVVSGNIAYLASATAGLITVDVSDAANPVKLATLDTQGYAMGVVVKGSVAYVANNLDGFVVVDVSDPANPAILHAIDTPGEAIKLAVAGNYAYIADGPSGLEVVQVSEPVALVEVGSGASSGSANAIKVHGRRVAVAQEQGIDVFDVGTVTAPTIEVSLPLVAGAQALDFSGDVAFVCAAGDLLSVELAGDSAVVLDTLATSSDLFGVQLVGDDAFVANGTGGFVSVDITAPAAMAFHGSLGLSGPATALEVAGDHAFVASAGRGLEVLDVTDPALPALVGSAVDGSSGSDVRLAGDVAFVAAGDLVAYDISDPTGPTRLAVHPTGGNTRAVDLAGDYLLAAGDDTLTLIDVTDPARPVEYGVASTTDARDVEIAGDLAYVADDGLRVFELFERWVDPGRNAAQSLAIDDNDAEIRRVRLFAEQTETVSWELSANGGTSWQALAPDGTWGRVGAPGSDLRWRSRHEYTTYRCNPRCTRLQVDWRYDFPVIDRVEDAPDDNGGWVRICFVRSAYDFADEEATPITAYDVYRRSARAGSSAEPLGAWERVITIFAQQRDEYVVLAPTVADSSDTIPYEVFYVSAQTATPSQHFDSAPDSGYSVDNKGLTAVTITSFVATYRAGAVDLEWGISDASGLRGFNVYRADGSDDRFTKVNAQLIAAGVSRYRDGEVHAGHRYRYRLGAVDRDGEVVSLTVAVVVPSGTLALYPNFPNPFNPVTTIEFDIAAPGRVRLDIFDVQGKVVRRLVDREEAPGHRSATWDGRDDDGSAVSSGIYFYRLRAGNRAITRRMMLLK